MKNIAGCKAFIPPNLNKHIAKFSYTFLSAFQAHKKAYQLLFAIANAELVSMFV
jgi:hypothetical protein